MADFIEIHIPLPQQTLERHSLFELNKDSAARWLRSLPSANLGETTRQLYLALVEFNKVKCNPKDRLQILEQLRHHVHVSNRGLEKHFLNQPIILPEKSRKVAQLADTLNKQMAIGYTVTANQFLSMHRLRRPKDQLAMAFHRAITEHSLVLLRNFQLYRDEEAGFWKTIHELFYQALKHKIAREKVADEVWGGSTLEQCYLRPMLLFTARPHQLRQANQADVFTQLSTWAQKASVRGDHLQDCVFLFNPTRDAPPTYRELCEDTAGWLGIDSRPLCKMLEDKIDVLAAGGKRDRNELGLGLLTHLHTSWGVMLQRNSVRIDREDDLLLSLGLFSTHFFVADSLPFSEFMRRAAKPDPNLIDISKEYGVRKRFDPTHDAWGEANLQDSKDKDSTIATREVHAIDYESSQNNAVSNAGTTQNYRYYRAAMVNASEKGYCVSWPANEAVKLNTGDVVGIREEAELTWSVGVIRWVKQVSESENQLGLEVLASVADAYSARLVRSGLPVGEHQRALMLPPDRDSGLPQRILVQKTAFNEGDSIELNRPGQTYRIKFQNCLVQTATLGIFAFSTMVKTESGEDVDAPLPTTSSTTDKVAQKDSKKKKQEFDNLWDDL
ncbi:hypothetical protein [Litorivivens sp.]|uniref:hypothetical protein n=1 Tax=Litorivivens sp. TaxID=2020868 RepID=UPI00356176B2